MKTIYTLTAIILIASCKKPGGSEKIYTIAGININTADSSTIINSNNIPVNLAFNITDSIAKRPDESKNKKKELEFIYENEWKAGGFRLWCNENLIRDKDTFKAHTNLFYTKATEDFLPLRWGQLSSANRINLPDITPPVLNKNYTFFISGTTNNNINYSDSCTIYIK